MIFLLALYSLSCAAPKPVVSAAGRNKFFVLYAACADKNDSA